jgi:hypothetical protein
MTKKVDKVYKMWYLKGMTIYTSLNVIEIIL